MPTMIQQRPPPEAPLRAPRRFRVVQVSTNDTRGGAALAAFRMHRALAGHGADSRMVVAQRRSGDPRVREYGPLPAAPAAVRRWIFRLARRLHRPSVERAGAFFSPEWSLFGRGLERALGRCDVVNLHWVADLFDYRTLPRLAARVPVVWTFHDMNVFTGGCHYDGGCERFTAACGSCPQLAGATSERDMTRRILERKRAIFGAVPAERLTVVCPSQWLGDAVRRSALLHRFDVRLIPSGVDLEEFRPMDRGEARRRLGLPASARVVLFVADAIDDKRKGLGPMLDALDALADVPDLLLVTLGRGGDPRLSGPRFRPLGVREDSDTLRAAYGAADVFVIPSLQDNCPNTLIEAMACGTPVAGFAVGGIAEAVEDGLTGALAPVGDAGALARGLRRILESAPLRRDLGAAARARAEKEYSADLMAARYAALYREVLP